MALKDWKKTSIGYDRDSSSSYYGNLRIIIGKKQKDGNTFVTILEDGLVIDNKEFKTKSQALAYANSYMRTH